MFQRSMKLYLIEILHQTTTHFFHRCCFGWLYLIEILHQTTTAASEGEQDLSLYLIEILHQTTTVFQTIYCLTSCILSKFYIKPQRWSGDAGSGGRCILSKFYIKPQPVASARSACAVVSYRNSTSNHNASLLIIWTIRVVSYRNSTSNHNYAGFSIPKTSVVSYRNSTSNHNGVNATMSGGSVVSYRNSTSNHNHPVKWSHGARLYLIEILHQTTTSDRCPGGWWSCILSKFYIKPQLSIPFTMTSGSCILSKFYIKPQPVIDVPEVDESCILSKFYIKPQQYSVAWKRFYVVSYRNSTSNHNSAGAPVAPGGVVSYRNSTSNHNTYTRRSYFERLYLIEILHQTTTKENVLYICESCILSKFYIKPQLARQWLMVPCGCILSKFYIKPQQRVRHKIGHSVVSYRNSTSNHNFILLRGLWRIVVSYRNSTSNHNLRQMRGVLASLYLIEILHQTTTR